MLLNIKHMFCEIIESKSAQATVEAAVMIPVIFLLILMLLQPGIILYDLTIMKSASSQTCRILSTCNQNDKQNICDSFARRRLSAIPQQDNFHFHSQGCSYEIILEGDQSSSTDSVTIKNQIKPLPLIGFLTDIFGILNQNKCFEISATTSQNLKPDWVTNSPQTSNPENWVGKWLPN